MTNILLRIFLKTTDPAENRTGTGTLSGMVGIVCNLLLFAGKLAVGTLSGSVSITADAMNNLSDASSAIVTLLGFKLAEKPADADHPYGHARFEYLSGLAVAALIVVIGVELAKTSIEKIRNPQAVAFTWLTVGVLLASMAVKLWLSVFNAKLAKKIQSTTLEATAQDSRNDVLATGAVLVAGAVEYFTTWSIDGWVGLAVAVFILYSGAKLGKETISPLLGEAASPELRQYIIDSVTSNCCVLGWHDLMVHDYGPGQRFASIHVEMDQRQDPLVCHEIIDDLERLCYQKHNVHLVIHYDPIVTNDPKLNVLRELVAKLAAEYDSRITIHDFRMVQGTGHSNLIFDIALPHDLAEEKKKVKAYIDNALKENTTENYNTVVTFDLTD